MVKRISRKRTRRNKTLRRNNKTPCRNNKSKRRTNKRYKKKMRGGMEAAATTPESEVRAEELPDNFICICW